MLNINLWIESKLKRKRRRSRQGERDLVLKTELKTFLSDEINEKHFFTEYILLQNKHWFLEKTQKTAIKNFEQDAI